MVSFVLYQFDKRDNSTLRPNIGTTNVQCAGEIKEPFNNINPNIIIFADVFNPFTYNYLYISAPLNKYYFVRRWTYDHGRYIGDCSIDVLATYRDNIIDSEQYIVRCSTKFNTDIIDTAYPVLPDVFSEFSYSNYGLLPYTTNIAQGTFIVGVNNDQMDNKFGATEFYMMNYNAIRSLTASLFGSVDWLNVQDISNNLLKTLFDPFQYYTSCYWLPFKFNDVKPAGKQPVDVINFGFWSQQFPDQQHYTTYPLNIETHENGYTFNMRFPIPKHPQYNRGRCYGSSTYNNYSLLLQPFGLIDIDTDMLNGHKNIVVNVVIQYFSRKAKIEIYTTDNDTDTSGPLIGVQFCENFGVDIPLGSVTQNAINPLQASVPLIKKGADDIAEWLGVSDSTLDTTKQITTRVGSLTSMYLSNGLSISTLGAVGSELIYNMPSVLIHRYRLVAEENLQEVGRPLMERTDLGTVTGYIQCDHPDTWNIPATYEQKELVKMYLQSGMFLERQ